MSGPGEDRAALGALDLHEQIARIDRARAEAEKFAAEQRKLAAEAVKLAAEREKFYAEQRKLTAEAYRLDQGAEAKKWAAEAAKYDRDRWLAPLLAVITVIGGMLGVASFIAKLVWG